MTSTNAQAMKICLAASECAPFAKTGGLADVVSELSKELFRQGHDVRPFVPLYATIDERFGPMRPVESVRNVPIKLGGHELLFSLFVAKLPGTKLDVFFVDCPAMFGRATIYTDQADELSRFVLLCNSVILSCQYMKWGPDIFHCHDWQTGLLPLLLRTNYVWDRLFQRSRTVFTIHNIGYQGLFSAADLASVGLTANLELLDQEDLATGRINSMKTGIRIADLITTVSPTYSKEILRSEYAMGLKNDLSARKDRLIGILNGVDYAEWNPETDPLIPRNFSSRNLAGKTICKVKLMEELGLSVVESRPLIGIVSRLVGQKGIDLVERAIPKLLDDRHFALAVLGSGEQRYEQFFSCLQQQFGDRVRYHRGHSNRLAHWIQAGADMFLMPSRYEPCGLNQLYSLRYGTIPIVRKTGGLADSILAYDERTGEGTGFVFTDVDPASLCGAIERALDVFEARDKWHSIVQKAMSQDFSWATQARIYINAYRRILGSGG